MGRIDTLRDVEVSRVPFEKFSDKCFGESSEKVRERIESQHVQIWGVRHLRCWQVENWVYLGCLINPG